MKCRTFPLFLIVGLLSVTIISSLFSCGSGGGGSGAGGSEADGTGFGSVAVFIADAPSDEYSAIYITINEVTLLPPDGDTSRSPVVIYRSDTGKTINLLDYRDNNDYLLKISHRVPSGSYEKIRLEISHIWAEPKPDSSAICTNNIKLPSGKIDLNPKGTFYVQRGGSLMIRLDIDANKALDIHPAGSSGKCIFRPVVFVDITEGKPVHHCPQIISGKITDILKDSQGQITGFTLDRSDHGDQVTVILLSNTVIFDGDFQLPGILSIGQNVKIVGTLDANLNFNASIVVIGDVLQVKGDVESPVQFINQDTGHFQFTPFYGESISGVVDVEVVRDNTIIFGDCNTILQPEDIMPRMTARVIGKYIATSDVLRAVAVILRPQEITGTLISWHFDIDGSTLVLDIDGTLIRVPRLSEPYFPYNQFYPIYFEQDGSVPLPFLCEGGIPQRQVRVILDPDISSPLTAQEVRIEAEPPTGVYGVVSQTTDQVIYLNNGERVSALPTATIIDQRPGGNVTSITEIESGSQIFYHGLDSCQGDLTADAYGFVIQIIP